MTSSNNTNPNTTERLAVSATPKSELVPAIQVVGFIPRVKVGTLHTNPVTGAVTKLSDKSKPCLGIPEDRSIVWGCGNFNPEDLAIYTAFCKSQGIPKDELAGKVLMQWFEDNRKAITEAADGFIAAEMSVEDLAKKLAAQQRSIAATQAMIDKMLRAAAEASEEAE